jgi:tRNA pseudouridine38-40 synthase
LPESIAIDGLQVAQEGFHARFSACGRIYLYQLYTSQVRVPLLDRYALRLLQEPDMASMREATTSLLGRQDYAAFGQPPRGTNTVRRVHEAVWCNHPMGALWPTAEMPGLYLKIEADAFLRGMVRRLVGTLLWVGQGKLTPTEFRDILESREISRAAPPAVARGLCLWQVKYAEELPSGRP